MMNSECRNKLVQVAAVILLASGFPAYAGDCAGGADATGNSCNGAQAAPGLSETDSRIVYLKGAAAMASLRLAQAQQRQGAANEAVKEAEKELQASLKALNETTKVTHR
jgi:hypothetical protein